MDVILLELPVSEYYLVRQTSPGNNLKANYWQEIETPKGSDRLVYLAYNQPFFLTETLAVCSSTRLCQKRKLLKEGSTKKMVRG
jgi:hypothetical protein